jgi:hypothetical protein
MINYMTSRILILLLTFSHLSCFSKVEGSDIEYIKVISLGDPDSISLYNKGVTLEEYLYYKPEDDSLVHSVFNETDAVYNYVLISRTSNQGVNDTINKLIALLKWRPNGFVDSTKISNLYDGGAYCGPTLYVQLKEGKAIHYYSFILGSNDTLREFSDLFFRLNSSGSQKQSLKMDAKDRDSVAVSMLKGLGYYDEMPTPYIGISCDSTVDPQRIFGTWRTVSTKYAVDSSTYSKLTINRDGSVKIDRLVRGNLRSTFLATFNLDKKKNLLVLSSKGNRRHYKVLKLTESCLEYQDRSHVIRYNRY